MPLISNIEILEKTEHPMIYIRTQTTVQDLPEHIGASYAKMGAYLEKNGRYLADVPFVSFYSFEDLNNMDVAMGFPLASSLEGAGEIKSGILPAGKVVSCMYLGPYNQIEQIYGQIMKRIEELGCEFVHPAYEFYYNGPEISEEHYLTEIRLPIREK